MVSVFFTSFPASPRTLQGSCHLHHLSHLCRHWAHPGQYDHLAHQEQYRWGSGISPEPLARYWPHPWKAGKGLGEMLEPRDGVGACLGKASLEVDPFGLPITPWGKCHDFGDAPRLHFFMGS